MRQRSFDIYQADWTVHRFEIKSLSGGEGIRKGQKCWSSQGSASEAPGFTAEPTLPAAAERQLAVNAGLVGRFESLYKSISLTPGKYVCQTPESQFDSVKKYDPWEHPMLYKEFSTTELSEKGVLQFANRYGRLGREEYEIILGHGGNIIIVEPYERWIAEIVRLRTAIALLQLARTKDEVALRVLEEKIDCVELHDGTFWPGDNDILKESWFESNPAHKAFRHYYPSRYTNHSFEKLYDDQERRRTYSKEQVLRQMAFNFASEQVNLELAFGVSPIATFDPKQPIHYAPRYLLATIYMQLAVDLRKRPAPTCRWCGNPMFGATGQRRYCNNSCRKKFDRNQKRLAVSS